LEHAGADSDDNGDCHSYKHNSHDGGDRLAITTAMVIQSVNS